MGIAGSLGKYFIEEAHRSHIAYRCGVRRKLFSYLKLTAARTDHSFFGEQTYIGIPFLPPLLLLLLFSSLYIYLSFKVCKCVFSI